jgi:hypothetical protein
MKCTAACFIGLSTLATAVSAQAADTSYLGTWKLTDAVIAPWADAKDKPDAAEKTRLIGKSVVLAPKAITGPNPFACTAPHYKVSNFATDMIFQGALGEMQSTSKAADPNKIAASLGFSGTSIRTLETGCEIDFHFVDAATAEIGLNNFVYTLKKQ